MTPQEAEAMTQRLTRVWSPLSTEAPQCIADGELYSFFAPIDVDVYLRVFVYRGRMSAELDWESKSCRLEWRDGAISSYWTVPNISNALGDGLARFTARWRAPFRRGCWLCGCPLEASAHEKAEWLQGFTREEVAAWNLNF